MSIRVGIVGIAGYGGGEALRYIAQHPRFKLVYAGGESTAGTRVGDRYPGAPGDIASLVIDKFDPTSLNNIDVLFTSLPTGASKEPLAEVPSHVKIVDIGGDHRYVDGWTYGLADVWPEQIKGATRIANPGCYPAATLTPLAPLLAGKLIEPSNIIVDAKSGVSGAGRGGGDSKFGYAECNEDLAAYGLLKHTHMPEIAATIDKLCGSSTPGATPGASSGLVFTPHLIPMTRGILATIYARGSASTQQCLDAARVFYAGRKFVRVTEKSPHTKWAAGSNLAFVSYACDPARNLVIALCAIDNLGKGAAGQAIQNANLMCGLDEDAGLAAAPMWP
ncbi:MAG: N-acetyl-gamma-glutamyl-phosphate reductase [Burkholderiales bacterium]|nr:N-acetyl-gamma-glutamyl-phosphate reductase [Phycisphaerae bacterium]